MRVIVHPTSRLETVKDDDERVIRLPAIGTVVGFAHGWSVTVRLDNFRGTRSFNATAIRPSDIISELALLYQLDQKRKPIDVRPRRGLSVVDQLASLDEAWRPIAEEDAP